MTDAPKSPAALIFGASGGIGSALARRLSAKGWRLALSARESRRLEALSAELSALSKAGDANDAKAVQNICSAAADKLGRLDGIVNCCGSILLKPAQLTTPDEWSHTGQVIAVDGGLSSMQSRMISLA